MIVYVETNFCLELAFQQEEKSHALEILNLTDAGKLELAFPQFAICEPFSTLNRYDNERRSFLNNLNAQLSELRRSAPQQPVVAGSLPLVATLNRLGQEQTNRLEDVIGRMPSCGRSIPLTGALFGLARKLELQFDLSPQDAIVAASVLGDLQTLKASTDSHVFLSRNAKDFNPMKTEFDALGCRYIAKFEQGLNFIRTKV